MRRVREHVHGLHLLHLVQRVEQLQVSRLSGGIAAHIHNALGSGVHYHLHHVGMHSGTWRVGDDNIRLAVPGYEIISQDVLHVARKERRVAYAVDGGIHLGVLDGLRHILDAHHLACLARHEVGYRSSSGV